MGRRDGTLSKRLEAAHTDEMEPKHLHPEP